MAYENVNAASQVVSVHDFFVETRKQGCGYKCEAFDEACNGNSLPPSQANVVQEDANCQALK